MQLTIAPPVDPPVERFNLRDYQVAFINEVYQAIREDHRSIACVAPTGAGKTVIMAQIAEHVVSRGKTLLVLVHLDVLVGQTYEKMKSFGLHHSTGFIKAGWTEDRGAPVQIGSVQTLGRRRWWESSRFDVVIYDEAHTTLFTQVGTKIRHTTHPEAIHLAFTATPYRLGKRTPQMGDRCSTLVSAPTPAKLQDMGQLATMRYFGLPPVDLAGVKMIGGDFSEADLKNRCDNPVLIERIVEEWERLTPGKRTIAFCVGVDHAHHVAQAFQDAGVAAGVVTGDTPIDERTRLYRALRDGTLTVLTSCNVISIGFDEPSVEVGLLLRPTTSLALHHQQIGRVMRVSPGKECGIILDQAGNILRLGTPEDIESYELQTADKTDRPPTEPVKKACPTCLSIVSVFETVCPTCGHVFPVKEPTIVDADLVEYAPRTAVEKRSERTYRSLLRKAFHKGFDPTWAAIQYQKNTGERPAKTWSRGAIFGDNPTNEDIRTYHTALYAIAARKFHSVENVSTVKGWILNHLVSEFGAKQAYLFLNNNP